MGARFTFTIPAMEESLSALQHRAALDPLQGGEKERILAADDNPEVLRYVRSQLAMAGYKPIVASEIGTQTSLFSHVGTPQ